jgi:predicted nucleotidyltransferase
LGDVLASGAAARLIALFALDPSRTFHFRALQRVTGLPNRSLQIELERLTRLGLIDRETVGRTIGFSTTNESRWRVLRELVREFASPADLLRPALAEVPGIQAAFIYGSFARRDDVHERSDVDVFVLGAEGNGLEFRHAIASAALEVGGFLGREVNVTRFTPERLAARRAEGRSNQFMQSVLSGEKDWLIGDETILRQVTRPVLRKKLSRRATVKSTA